MNINPALIQFLEPFTNSWANPIGVLCNHILGYLKHGGGKCKEIIKIGPDLLHGGYHLCTYRAAVGEQTLP